MHEEMTNGHNEHKLSEIFAEKIKQLERISGANSFAHFATLIGINTQTLRRLGIRRDGSDRVINRIVKRFSGLTADTLLDPEKRIAEGVKFMPLIREEINEGQPTEGDLLKRYMDNKGIRASRLSEMMGVSRPAVHSYLKTIRFEQTTKAAILAALRVPESAIFIDTSFVGMNNQRAPVKLVGVLLITPKDRVVEADELTDKIQKFTPTFSPDKTFFIHPELIELKPADLAFCLAIQITQSDRLAPMFLPGAIVLARLVESSEWWSVASSSVALLIGGRLQVRRLLRNDLRGSAMMEVGSFDSTLGSFQLISQNDIQQMFSITHILLSPV